MTFDRRLFLKSLGAGALALSPLGFARPAHAAAALDRQFVFVYFSGGWDHILSLDPRDPNVFTEARMGTTKIELAWDRIPEVFPRTIVQPRGARIGLGPVMGRIAEHTDVMCVVRGMTMETVTHEVGRRFFITGMTPRGSRAAGSSGGTRVVAQQGDRRPLPHLVSRVETYNEGEATFASGMSVNGAPDLVTALQAGAQAPTGVVREQLAAYRDRVAPCDPTSLDKRGFLGLLRSSQTKARDLVGSGLATHFNFAASNMAADVQALRTRYGITTNFLTPGAQAALAFQALKHQVAQAVSIELVSGLDTHDADWADDQPNLQANGWNALAQLVTDLKAEAHPAGGTHMDHTTIVVFSEFTRTPLLNSRDGRDHSLTNSCMLLGAGVPHNRVVGASTDVGMGPQEIDPTTGEVARAGGVKITPNDVMASILESAGMVTDKLRARGLPCLMA